MKLRPLALAVAAVAAAGIASPAAAADKETRQMMADIRMLQEQEQQIQTLIATLTDQVKALEKSVNGRIDEEVEASRKGFADQKAVTTSVQSDLRTLRERLDDNTTRLGQNVTEVQALRQLITSRTFAAPAPDTLSSSGAPDTGAPAAPDATSAAAAGESPTALYNAAYGDYSAGQYDLAIDGFQAYIKSFPTGPQAADAQVNICNSYLQDKKYTEAVDACDTAIRNYPNASVIPMAYYKKGLAYKDLGQLDQARTAFEYVMKTWPDSTERALSDQNLQSLPPASKKP